MSDRVDKPDESQEIFECGMGRRGDDGSLWFCKHEYSGQTCPHFSEVTDAEDPFNAEFFHAE